MSVANVKEHLGKLSVTGWLLFGGLVVAGLGIFFPWQSISVDGGLGGTYSDSSSLAGGGRFLILLVVAAALWLSWPTHSGSKMSVKRTTGLTLVVGLLGLFVILAFVGVSHNNTVNAGSGVKFGPGLGLLLYTAAVIAAVVGVVRVWMHRSGVEGLAP